MIFGPGVHPSIDRSTDVKDRALFGTRAPFRLFARSDPRGSTLRLCASSKEGTPQSHAHSRKKASSTGYVRRTMGGQSGSARVWMCGAVKGKFIDVGNNVIPW